MTGVIADISMSVDGFVTGPNAALRNGLGGGEEMGYGADLAGTPPFFVVTHERPAAVRLELDFTFVTDGVAGAVIRQVVDAGLADELHLPLSPVVLGDGTPLFDGASRRELVQRSVRVSSTATHLVYDVASGPT